MKNILRIALSFTLGSFVVTQLAFADTPPQGQKMILESSAEGMPFWSISLGAEEANRPLVWIDFNNDGIKDEGEGWNEATTSPVSGLCSFETDKSSLTITIHGPVTVLSCADNDLVSLKVRENEHLIKLIAQGNLLREIDLSQNTRLEVLSLSDNLLSQVGLTGMTKLRDLRVNGNTAIDNLGLQDVEALMKMDISQTSITSLPEGNFSSLTALNISGNANFTLDLSRIANMEELVVGECALSELDLTGLKKLKTLWAPNNKLRELNFSNNPELIQLMLKYNQLTSIDLSKSPKLKKLYLENNDIQSLNLYTENSLLEVLDCAGNTSLTSIDLSKYPNLFALQFNGTGVTSLDVSTNPLLKELSVGETRIEKLDLSKNPKLVTLNVANCQLSEINLSLNTQLEVLYCAGNKIKKMDLRNASKLREFRGEDNLIEELLFQSEVLSEVFCYGNRIKGEAMDKLVESLFQVEEGRLVVVDLSSGKEENRCSTTHVEKLKAKGWSVWDWNSVQREPLPYEGYKDDGVVEATFETVRAYPSVVNEKVTLSGSLGREYTIYNLFGNIVLQDTLREEVETVSVESLPVGTYFVKFADVEQVYSIRIVR